MRICTKCNIEKPLHGFHKHTGGKFGRSPSCKVCHSLTAKRRYTENRIVEIKRSNEYYALNKESVYARTKAYGSKRIATDLNFRLARNLRTRLSKTVRQNSQTSSAVHSLGCSLNEFRTHMSGKFKAGMTWENYGQWEIDHVVPLAKFDLTNSAEADKALHYSNLQPLWKLENRIKGAR